MSLENNTRLRIGMHANFNGLDYQLMGRSVLGETEAGETYYWSEFNLETQSGDEATLVYEETERGGQWRLFTQFEPEYPMTAADAATKQVGDQLNLTDKTVRVTFRGASRVFKVEGKGPEGENAGTEAEYFNAEAGGIMQVVSWTGEEVEFYNGLSLSSGMVASAFKVPSAELAPAGGGIFSSFTGSGSGNSSNPGRVIGLTVFIIVIFFLFYGRNLSCSTNYEGGAVKKTFAGPPPLLVGAAGQMDGRNFRITAHAIVEIAEVNAKWERHEYQLTDDYGAKALLVAGTRAGADEWMLLYSVSPLQAPTAQQLAAKKMGESVAVDTFSGKVGEIFQATIELTDGGPLTGLATGTVTYGLASANGTETLLARWNGSAIQFFQGKAVPSKQVKTVFGGGK
jgi:hypothetical protein